MDAIDKLTEVFTQRQPVEDAIAAHLVHADEIAGHLGVTAEALRASMAKHLKSLPFPRLLAETYAEHFNEEEIQEYLDFVETDFGGKLVRMFPAINAAYVLKTEVLVEGAYAGMIRDLVSPEVAEEIFGVDAPDGIEDGTDLE